MLADSILLEPDWIKIRRVRLSPGKPTHRFVQFTDVHHKGNRKLLDDVISKINALSPDFVCFTGDIIEETRHLPEALEALAKLKSPAYGVPGNHDYWSNMPFDGISQCFAGTGGAWLMDEQRVTGDGKFTISGSAARSAKVLPPRGNTSTRNILLVHYPAWVKNLGGQKYDLTLAGHSHGGQVRIPFYGPVLVPFNVDEYDLGMFQTAAGPLYVNPGIGWFPLPVRFNCRPEITVFEI